jgi:glycosyltransferase involved in cell wall biosynthesis
MGARPEGQAPVTRHTQCIGFLGTYLPRQCGIATFTSDLTAAFAAQFPRIRRVVVAMNDPGRQHAYPPEVRFEIPQNDTDAYLRAADFINVNAIDVLSLQHEYGIFGGKAGSHVLLMLRALRVPVVTTLHTVLGSPDEHQLRVMRDLAALSQRLVVMSELGATLLHDRYGIPASQIDLIPHGSPTVPTAAEAKERLGLQGRTVLLTFGLLSPDKGIEYVIEALPAILAGTPDVIYVVLGTTHPHVREQQGEQYRVALAAQARELGVEANVIFHDRFVSADELADFLGAADICLTPYLQPEQITSGALAYAVGAGRAIISTPFRYAADLLAEGRGILVPWRDAAAIAREVSSLIADDEERRALGKRAGVLGMGMHWPAIAQQYLETFARARSHHADVVGSQPSAGTLAERPVALPELNLAHLRRMTDDTGLLQHARYSVPRYGDGYCLDDNARALLLMADIEDSGTDEGAAIRSLADRYLAFVSHAFDRESQRFRNFLSYGRVWMEPHGSEDSHGRAVWSLGTVVSRSATPGARSLAGDLFHAALPAVREFQSPRAWAYSLLGIDEYLSVSAGDRSIEATRDELAERLLGLYRRVGAPGWPWFEEYLTYCNARLPEALIVSGARMGHAEMTDAGVASLEWLLSVQVADDGHFAPVGTDGFFRRGTQAARFDQQPVEACGSVSACLAAQRATGDQRWAIRARQAFDWFLGRNDLRVPLYDPATGGCRDGIHFDRVNENQGAESTLSFLQALHDVRAAQITSPPLVRA